MTLSHSIIKYLVNFWNKVYVTFTKQVLSQRIRILRNYKTMCQLGKIAENVTGIIYR